MSAFLQLVANHFLPTLLGLLATFGTFIAGRAVVLFDRHVTNAEIDAAFARLDAAVSVALAQAGKTVATDLAGGVTTLALTQVRKDLVALAKSYVGDKGLAVLEDVLGLPNLESLLSAKLQTSAIATVGQAVTVVASK